VSVVKKIENNRLIYAKCGNEWSKSRTHITNSLRYITMETWRAWYI